jgi:hypothetical protein
MITRGILWNMRWDASEGSFAKACSVINQVCSSIPYAQVFIKREAALVDNFKEDAPTIMSSRVKHLGTKEKIDYDIKYGYDLPCRDGSHSD